MITLTIPMAFYEDKKHSVRYNATDKDAAVSSIYLMRKDLPNGKAPKTINVKVEMENE